MRRVDVAAGGAAALLGAVAWGLTVPFPVVPGGHPGPALFPRIVAGLLIAFGGVLAFQGLRAPASRHAGGILEGADRAGVVNALLVVAAVVFYILAVEPVGFLLTVGLLNVALLRRLGVGLLAAAGVAAALALGVYLLFARLLMVPLPRGPIPF